MLLTPALMVSLALAAVSSNPKAPPFPYASDEAEHSEAIGSDELRAHVYRLCSPEFLGRRGPGAARTSRHLQEAFRRLGLKPAFGDSFFQPIPWLVAASRDRAADFVGRNVAGVIEGSDPQLKDEWIVLSAHYDHLGVQDDCLYPGADDNASGVAMLLEVAEWFSLRAQRPRRTVMFVAFDLEESALLGSTHFAAHPPRDCHKLKAFLTADMIGRSMANIMKESVFALGGESAAELRRLLDDVPPERGLKVGRLDAEIIGSRGDYGPFRDRRIPFLFFSTGQHPDYHRATDLPDRLDYDKLAKVSRWIAQLTARLADVAEAPTWQPGHGQDMQQVSTILWLVGRTVKRAPATTLTPRQRELLEAFAAKLKAIQNRGQLTDDERTWLVWSTRLLLMSVF